MIKRFDGANWVDISGAKRWDGANWIQVSSVKRWDGANWAECLLTLPQIKDNVDCIRLYHKTLSVSGDSDFEIDAFGNLDYTTRPSWQDSDILALIGFKLAMKNGSEYEIDRQLLTKLNCKVFLKMYPNVRGNTPSESSNYSMVSYCGLTFHRNPGSLETRGDYLSEIEEALTVRVRCSTEPHATHNSSVTILRDMEDIHFKSLSTGEIVTLPKKAVWSGT